MKQNTLSLKVKALTLVAAFFIFIAILAMLGHNPYVLAKLNAWKLLPQPETFTELYFAAYPQEASQVPDGTKVSFTFVVHNLEGATTTYPYMVYLLQPGVGTTTIDSGSFTLADSASTTVAEAHALRSAYEPGMFSVVLPVQNLHIDFYIPNPTAQ